MNRNLNSWKIFILLLATAPMNHAMDTSFETITNQSEGPPSKMERFSGGSSISQNQSSGELGDSSLNYLYEKDQGYDALDTVARSTSSQQEVNTSTQLIPESSDTEYYDALDTVVKSTSNQQEVNTSIQLIPESSDSPDITSYMKEIRVLKNKIKKQKSDITNLENTLSEKLSKNQKEISVLNKNIENLEIQKSEIAETIRNKENDIKKHEENIENLEIQKSEIAETIKDKENDIKKHEEKLNSEKDLLDESLDQYSKYIEKSSKVIEEEGGKLSDLYAKTSYRDSLSNFVPAFVSRIIGTTNQGKEYNARRIQLEEYKKELNSIKENTE